MRGGGRGGGSALDLRFALLVSVLELDKSVNISHKILGGRLCKPDRWIAVWANVPKITKTTERTTRAAYSSWISMIFS